MKAHDLCFINCFLWFQAILIFLRASMGKATSLDWVSFNSSYFASLSCWVNGTAIREEICISDFLSYKLINFKYYFHTAVWKTLFIVYQQTKPNKTKTLSTRQKFNSSALFCLYPKYSWTMARVIENGIGLNDKGFQIENVSDTS